MSETPQPLSLVQAIENTLWDGQPIAATGYRMTAWRSVEANAERVVNVLRVFGIDAADFGGSPISR